MLAEAQFGNVINKAKKAVRDKVEQKATQTKNAAKEKVEKKADKDKDKMLPKRRGYLCLPAAR